MAQKSIQFNGSVNPALQVNDNVWVANLNTATGITDPPDKIGYVVELFASEILVEITNASIVVAPSMYLLFSKPIEVNEASVKGYYADVTLKNTSKTYAELFAISSEVTPSSK